MSREIFFEDFIRSSLLPGQLLLSLTGKPFFPSERGRGTRKENELNQIPHPAKSYHASGNSTSAQLGPSTGCPAGKDKFNKRWEMGVGERDGILKTPLLRLASSFKFK